jgi:hypothetical protein
LVHPLLTIACWAHADRVIRGSQLNPSYLRYLEAVCVARSRCAANAPPLPGFDFEGAGSPFPFFLPRRGEAMERREAPAGLRDPLWRSLAIGPAGEAGEASRPRWCGGGASRLSIRGALSSAAPRLASGASRWQPFGQERCRTIYLAKEVSQGLFSGKASRRTNNATRRMRLARTAKYIIYSRTNGRSPALRPLAAREHTRSAIVWQRAGWGCRRNSFCCSPPASSRN